MTKEEIKKLFPEIDDVQSNELQEKTIKAFQIAFEQGGWDKDNIHKAPVTLNWDGCKIALIEHIRDVTTMAKMSYDHLSKYYVQNNASIDRDVVICGALLHDLGKLTEFSMKDGVLQHSENYNLLRHPLSGAIMASMAGLPDKIVHLIAVHSFEGDQSYQTNESRFVQEIDKFVFDNGVCGLKKKI